jgi:hypothetical protein
MLFAHLKRILRLDRLRLRGRFWAVAANRNSSLARLGRRREKPGHCYRILARQLFDFDLAILGHKLGAKTEFPSSFPASILSPR